MSSQPDGWHLREIRFCISRIFVPVIGEVVVPDAFDGRGAFVLRFWHGDLFALRLNFDLSLDQENDFNRSK